jgi:TolB protein
VINADGTNRVVLTNNPDDDDESPSWFPDASKITFTSRDSGGNQIYEMNADGSNPVKLTNGPVNYFQPSWSPDGKGLHLLLMLN